MRRGCHAFLLEELDGPYERVLLRLMGTETAQEAAEVFMRGFLAPHPKYRHLEERVAFANAYLEGDFSGAGCASVHVTYEMGHIEAVAECPKDVAGVRPVPRPAWIEAVHARDPDRVATDQIRVTDPFRTAEISAPEPS